MRYAVAALMLCLFLSLSAAEARTSPTHLPISFDTRHDLGGYVTPTWSRSRIVKRSAKRHAKKHHRSRAVAHKGTLQGYGRHIAKTASLDAVVAPLAAKARQIIGDCGARVSSAFRPGARVNGAGRPSLHSRYPAEAVDMQGPVACILARLRGWPGGYSTDYAAVNHIHISLAHDRKERGLRFAHHSAKRYRYAALRR